MMTADMDRLTAKAGVPQRAGRHGAPRPSYGSPAPPATPAGDGSPGPRPVRRIVTGVLVGALTMFGVATLDAFAGATVPVLGSFAALPAPPDVPEVVEMPAPPATPGTCLTWSRPDAADTEVVDCGQPHLFEQAGSVLLTDRIELPDDREWRQIVDERCEPVVLEYLGGKFDPDGRYRIGALKPSPMKWAEGDRELRCGLQSASRSGALYQLSGRVAESDQASVHEAGTCLAIDGRTIGDPVDCAGPHAVETVGIVDLSAQFPEAYPQVSDQDAFLQPECKRIADEYAGGPEVIAEKDLTVYWDNLSEESWNAGTRKVNCNLAALLPDRSGFAPVTGPVRGDVVVGETPAPPATNTPEPGVPAPSTTAPAPTPTGTPPVEPTPTQTGEPPAGDEEPGDAPDSPSPEPPDADEGNEPPPPVAPELPVPTEEN
ncbi:septum formation family protein [Pseudonocardia nigra]|uniref:septum formation family protein n=1 Tax=Pseudonocardia nigra TaxID=1921578 RepID=UPI001C5F618E|nr:septum formation family protein [Pseudonocardia nigra]